MALLEPALFARTYLVAPDFGDQRKTDNKKRKADWVAQHARAVVLDSKDGVKMLGMVRAVVAHPLARPLLERGLPEATVIGRCPVTGLRAKVRPDDLREDIGTIVDVKRARDASPRGFARSVADYRYHVQDALYRAVVREVGPDVRHFVFVAVEPEPPHLVAVHSLDLDALRVGHREWQKDAETLARCLEADTWPGYPETINEITLPPWAA
jgi:exodeoxyribonuclease VIII